MHPFRLPSIDQGVQAFVWACALGAFIWAGLLAVGASGVTAVVMAIIGFFVIFLYVRLWGGDEPRPHPHQQQQPPPRRPAG